jgi:hypothetical protein
VACSKTGSGVIGTKEKVLDFVGVFQEISVLQLCVGSY